MKILKNILWMKKETIEMLYLDNNSLDSKDIKSILMDFDFNINQLISLNQQSISNQPGLSKLSLIDF